MIELILGAPKATDKNLHLIIEAVNKINGLKYIHYCEEHKLILLTYEADVFRTADQVIESLKKQQVTMPLFIKEGNFSIIKEMCK